MSVLHFVCLCWWCVSDCGVDEVDGLGFMMITLPKDVQNQSHPKSECFHPLSTGDFKGWYRLFHSFLLFFLFFLGGGEGIEKWKDDNAIGELGG